MIQFMIVLAAINVALSFGISAYHGSAMSTVVVVQLLLFLLAVTAGCFEIRRVRRLEQKAFDAGRWMNPLGLPKDAAAGALDSLEKQMATYRREDLANG